MIDVAPTILDLAGIPVPDTVDGIEQEPMHGTTFAPSLTDAAAPEHRTQQYFETIGNRGMYKDGWWLAMKTERIPWVLTPEAIAPYAPGVWDPDDGPGRAVLPARRLLPGQRPGRRAPGEGRRSSRSCSGRRPSATGCCRCSPRCRRSSACCRPIPEETTFEFRGDVQNVMSGMIPRIYNRSYSITADLVVPDGGAEGVIVAEADHLGGFTLYVKDGKLTHTYSMMGVFIFKQVAEEDLPSGDVTVAHGVRGRRRHSRRPAAR